MEKGKSMHPCIQPASHHFGGKLTYPQRWQRSWIESLLYNQLFNNHLRLQITKRYLQYNLSLKLQLPHTSHAIMKLHFGCLATSSPFTTGCSTPQLQDGGSLKCPGWRPALCQMSLHFKILSLCCTFDVCIFGPAFHSVLLALVFPLRTNILFPWG